jgi:ribulose-phosphate 3-epimerase
MSESKPGSVIPAIIPESLEDLSKHILALKETTDAFQVDIVDGIFVPHVSWPYKDDSPIKDIRENIEGLNIELDLMIREPERTLPEWLKTGVDRFVIHIEGTNDVSHCISLVTQAGKKVGIALNNDEPVALIESYIPNIDFVQCMGIAEIGKQGQEFDERVLAHIEALAEKYPELEVAVDGGVSEDTIKKLYKAGASRLVSGSAIIQADSPVAAYNALLKQVS